MRFCSQKKAFQVTFVHTILAGMGIQTTSPKWTAPVVMVLCKPSQLSPSLVHQIVLTVGKEG